MKKKLLLFIFSFMKKVLLSFTFYFMLLSLYIIHMHQIGLDHYGIVLISFNIILNGLAHNDLARKVLNSGSRINCNTILGSISVYWYYVHFISFIIYGIILDGIKLFLKGLSVFVEKKLKL